MKAWEVIAVIILMCIIFFVFYIVAYLELFPPFANFVQNFMLIVGKLLRLDRIVIFIKEILHIG